MDRDIARSMVNQMTALNNELTKLSEYALPAGVTREAKMLLMDEPVEETVEEPVEEPVTTTTKKRTTNK